MISRRYLAIAWSPSPEVAAPVSGLLGRGPRRPRGADPLQIRAKRLPRGTGGRRRPHPARPLPPETDQWIQWRRSMQRIHGMTQAVSLWAMTALAGGCAGAQTPSSGPSRMAWAELKNARGESVGSALLREQDGKVHIVVQ